MGSAKLVERRNAVPGQVEELARRRRELVEQAACDLALFREALREFGGQWMRETARRVAVSQSAVTLALGREKLASLKRAIEERVGGLADAIGREFTPDRYATADGASSGQVAPLLERRFDAGVRRVLAGIWPTLEGAGYRREEPWLETAGAAAADKLRERLRAHVELPPDLRDLIGRVVEAITEERVIEAKISYFEKQREKEMAADLWEKA